MLFTLSRTIIALSLFCLLSTAFSFSHFFICWVEKVEKKLETLGHKGKSGNKTALKQEGSLRNIKSMSSEEFILDGSASDEQREDEESFISYSKPLEEPLNFISFMDS